VRSFAWMPVTVVNSWFHKLRPYSRNTGILFSDSVIPALGEDYFLSGAI